MSLSELRISRRSVAIAAVLVGMVSLAIGAHAALNMRALDAAKTTASRQNSDAAGNKPSRIALVIGNGHYPDANAPLTQPINDARALTASLRRDGFDVDVVEDATRDDMDRALVRLKSRIKPDSVVMLYFGGYGVQVGHESYMIPVDAVIWKETDVRRDGLSIETVLDAMKEQGACAKLVVIDASRRNPYERRFRTFSHGLAPITAPDNALILTSATPGQVADDSSGQHSVLMTELLANLNSLNAQESSKAESSKALAAGTEANKAAAAAETIFNKTRIAISRASDGAQVPSVSSSLLEDVRFGVTANAGGGG